MNAERDGDGLHADTGSRDPKVSCVGEELHAGAEFHTHAGIPALFPGCAFAKDEVHWYDCSAAVEPIRIADHGCAHGRPCELELPGIDSVPGLEVCIRPFVMADVVTRVQREPMKLGMPVIAGVENR